MRTCVYILRAQIKSDVEASAYTIHGLLWREGRPREMPQELVGQLTWCAGLVLEEVENEDQCLSLSSDLYICAMVCMCLHTHKHAEHTYITCAYIKYKIYDRHNIKKIGLTL